MEPPRALLQSQRFFKRNEERQSMLRTVKESIRRGMYACGLEKLHTRLREFNGRNVRHLYFTSLEERFSAIYKNRAWVSSSNPGSLSGPGSDLSSTVYIRRELPKVLSDLGTATLVDIGCGDFGWMKEVQLPCKYIGIDIVPDLIEENQALYGSATRAFKSLDATCTALPEADTALCREVLFHLSAADMWGLFKNLHDSPIRYLIATTDISVKLNKDILSGDYRALNLSKPPFSFPRPIIEINDNAMSSNRILAVWEVSSLPHPPPQ
jgi:hypothetical protein